jgi:hypothetical protein
LRGDESIRPSLLTGVRRRCEPRAKKLGRPKVGGEKEDVIRARLLAGDGMQKVARKLGVGVSTVQRVKAEMVAVPVTLSTW